MTSPSPPIGWKPVLAAIASARAFRIVAAVLFVLEIAAIPILSRIVPDTAYLRAYLPWQAVEQTRRFLAKELDVIPDPKLGWRNRPGHVHRNIRYDRFGSRSSAGLVPDVRKPHRVVFLGDSRTNGYTFVSNAETISARMENESVETLNLATAFYGPDQMVMALEEALETFSPDVAVIGLGSDTHQLLAGHYIPFLAPDEYGMPFLKPRFAMDEKGRWTPVVPDPERLLAGVPDNPALLSFLAERDPLYRRFETFRRYRCLPMIGLLSELGRGWDGISAKARKWAGIREPDEPIGFETEFRALIDRARKLGATHGASVGFVLYPSLSEFLGGNTGNYDRVAGILQSERVPFVDGRALLKRYRGAENLYGDDLHFTAAANRVLAEALSRALLRGGPNEPVIAR